MASKNHPRHLSIPELNWLQLDLIDISNLFNSKHLLNRFFYYYFISCIPFSYLTSVFHLAIKCFFSSPLVSKHWNLPISFLLNIL